MKKYIEDRMVGILLSTVYFLPELSRKQHDAVWHVHDPYPPEDGRIIIAKWENKHQPSEILRVSWETATDELKEWAYLDDLI